ncbi:MAG: type II secretion system GspH family protein [Candidatus Omnitrophica bacterium]|nr:type II secretion system GspH family protein [Candidatus Omnitrophota bacterium]
MKAGFSLLELVISIFLVALVIAGTLLLLAANLMLIQKAQERVLATAVAQGQAELVKGIDFPPIYYDLEDDFGEETDIENPQPGAGTDYSEEEYRDKFKVYRYVVGYDASGRVVEATLSKEDYYDRAVLLKVYIYVLRRKNNYPVLSTVVFVSKNGLY